MAQLRNGNQFRDTASQWSDVNVEISQKVSIDKESNKIDNYVGGGKIQNNKQTETANKEVLTAQGVLKLQPWDPRKLPYAIYMREFLKTQEMVTPLSGLEYNFTTSTRRPGFIKVLNYFSRLKNTTS